MDSAEIFASSTYKVNKDIVTVHGLSEAGPKPWADAPGRPRWLERSLFHDADARVISFNYDAAPQEDMVLTKSGLESVARRLLDCILSWRESPDLQNRPLAFVAHDIGGTVLKQAMVLASWDEARYGTILRSTYSVVFAGCPHRPASRVALAGCIANLISKRNHIPKFGWLRTAELCADTILETNDLFLSTGVLLQARIGNVFWEDTDSGNHVFNRFTATLDISTELAIGRLHDFAAESFSEDDVAKPSESTPPALHAVRLLSGKMDRNIYASLRNVLGCKPTHTHSHGDDDDDSSESDTDSDSSSDSESGSDTDPSDDHPSFTTSMYPINSTPPGLRFLMGAATPVHIPSRKTNPKVFQWLLLNSPDVLDSLLTRTTAAAYLLSSSTGDDKTTAIGLNCMLRLLEDQQRARRALRGHDVPHRVVFSFQFRNNKTGGHRHPNTTRTLLMNLLAQALNFVMRRTSELERPEHVLEALEVQSEFQAVEVLLRLFNDVNVWLAQRGIPVLWIIWGVEAWSDTAEHDLAGSVRSVLQNNGSRFLEARPAFLFSALDEDEGGGGGGTSHNSGGISEAMAAAGVERLDIGQPSSADIFSLSVSTPTAGGVMRPEQAQALELQLLHACLGRPSIELFAVIDGAVEKLRGESSLSVILLRWVTEMASQTPSSVWKESIMAAVAQLSPENPSPLFRAVLGSLEPRQRSWAIKILRWVVYSVRPLSPSNILDTMRLEASDAGSNEVLPEISDPMFSAVRRWLSGMIRIEDNEVGLRHEAVRDILLDMSGEQEASMDRNEFHHAYLLGQLLRYLSMEHVYMMLNSPAFLERYPTTPSPESVSRQGLTWYAVRFWPDHYRAAVGDAERPTPKLAQEQVRSHLKLFLTNDAAVRFVIDANRRLGSPERLEGTNNKAHAKLHLLARSGLSAEEISFAVTDDPIIAGNCWQNEMALVCEALLGAIQSRNMELISTLLPTLSKLKPNDIRDIFLEAAASEDATTMMLVFNQATQHQLTLPGQFVIQAARLGLGEIMAAIVQDTDSKLVEEDFDHVRVLQVSLVWRQPGITQLLTDYLASLCEMSEGDLSEAIRRACWAGDPTQIRHLHQLCSNAKVRSRNGYRYSDLLGASEYGSHQVINEMLQLLEHPADGLLSTPEGKRCLAISVVKGWRECTRALLEYVNPERDHTVLLRVLRRGIKAQQLETCRILVAKGLNLQHAPGDTPLLSLAARRGNIELINLLHEHHAELEATNEYGETPLHVAVSRGANKVAERLLELGPNINATLLHGGSVIYYACLKQKVDLVKLLLERGADIHIATLNRGWSPLEASYDLPKILQLLCKHTPKPNFHREVQSRGIIRGPVTALYLAVHGGHTESVKTLLSAWDEDKAIGPNIEYKLPEGCGELSDYTCLAIAAEKGEQEMARMFLERRANVNHCIMGRLPILHTVTDEETLKALLEYNANLELKDQAGRTVLNLHASTSWPDVTVSFLRRLVNAGADLETQDAVGDTPLANSAAVGNSAFLDFLIERGACLDGRGAKFGTPIHRALVNDQLGSVKRLVAAKANINITGYTFGTPLQMAFGRDSESELVTLFLDAGADVNAAGGREGNVVIAASRRGSLEAVKLVLDAGGSPTSVDRIGLSPAMAACRRQDDALEVVRLLEEHGADISAQTKRDFLGRTMLHAAALSADVALVQHVHAALSSAAAGDPTAEVDKSGWTPLHWAVRPACLFSPALKEHTRPSVEGQVEVVRYLLDRRSPELLGGPPVEVDGVQWTVLGLAKYHGAPQQVIDAVVDAMRQDSLDVDNDPGSSLTVEETSQGNLACDVCCCYMRGKSYTCSSELCHDSWSLCFSCFAHKNELHDPEHSFTARDVKPVDSEEVLSDAESD
ncbi:ankyrin repeat-containing domain protein [Cercophora newfieldiana]|uniref:Ankyrin repeat-containing domain protein n=1 Tax=Cercophora newfieldiana TaxID=92897 RepID=A0AA40CQY4_9PEZI|nr:ankyrin repeat-containing domain protein [Cercophora newfieldiana]